jgi:hypothetical protein
MPDFWQFPTGSMGIGTHQLHLPRSIHALPYRAPADRWTAANEKYGACLAMVKWMNPRA